MDLYQINLSGIQVYKYFRNIIYCTKIDISQKVMGLERSFLLFKSISFDVFLTIFVKNGYLKFTCNFVAWKQTFVSALK